MTGRINDVDAHILTFAQLINTFFRQLLPTSRDCGGGNCDTALFFLLHPVRGGRAIMHFTDLVDHARIKQDTLGQRCLARINVGADADVARALKRILAVW